MSVLKVSTDQSVRMEANELVENRYAVWKYAN